jgi:hypothetical protein
MKKTVLSLAAAILVLAFSGCGGGGDGKVVVVPNAVGILSDQVFDGDITRDSSTGILSLPTSAADTQNVLFGVVFDPLTGGEISETRGFFHFTLTGTQVPVNPDRINFASIIMFVNSVTPVAADRFAQIPLVVDLIDTGQFPAPIVSTDFSIFSFSSGATFISGSHAGAFAEFDITPLLKDAVSLGLADFEVRFRFDRERFQTDLTTIPGLVEIEDADDTPGHRRSDFAPLLHVEFF